jgi:hypothetical protein
MYKLWHEKLSFKFFGPFKIIQCVGSIAYKLPLPATSKIRPVVHVSRLKHAMGTRCVALPSLPSDSYQFNVPEQILQRRVVTQGVHSCS